ncbi:hypothetical protein K469DRAFT_693823 [Zopfia rhizophila CBS 207.26]|uniref:Uncharacterized protein n=1 Tax=Zopfia rhizophila CBS 207.26 TaxID=1314779 RepID=A0A6A6DPX8_9PEZI|nr:hypothetical protein K469DRAFT_693823 [Zopfia rhizophila CBS 207.26]
MELAEHGGKKKHSLGRFLKRHLHELGSFVLGGRKPSAGQQAALQQRMKELEADLEVESTKKNKDEELCSSGRSLDDLQKHAGGVPLTTGVEVVDREKFDKLFEEDGSE